MPSTILSRTFSAVVDQRIVLSNSQFARPFSIATWTKLRIALRFNMNNTGANIVTPNFWVGLSSGTTNLVMDATTDNWCGVKSNGSWSYVSPPATYNAFNFYATKRVGSTITSTATDLCDSSQPGELADATIEARGLFFVDITKGSPNYTFALGIYRGSAAVNDTTAADFILQAPSGAPTATNHHSTATPRTLAVDETTGVFDTVNIGWDQASPTIEICDLAVVKLA